MRVLDPLSGSEESIRTLAQGFDGSAEDLRAVARSVRALGTDAVWDGPAGASFGARLAEIGPILQGVIDRYSAAAAALSAYAPEFGEIQRRVQCAVEDHIAATDLIAAAEDRITSLVMSGVPYEAAQVQAVVEEQRGYVGRQMAAQAAHARAWSDFDEADGRCAAALSRAADDALADSAPYHLLARVSEIGAQGGQFGALGLAIPEVTPVAATMSSAGSVADLGLLVFYDEGSWASVLQGLSLDALGFAGGVLKTGATVGAVKSVNREYAVQRALSTRQRLAAGLRSQTDSAIADLHGLRKVPSLPESSRSITDFVTKVPLKEKLKPAALQAKASEAATEFARKRLLDDLAMARANGTTGMFVSGVTLEVTSEVGAEVSDRLETK